jgi:hypothetical protein
VVYAAFINRKRSAVSVVATFVGGGICNRRGSSVDYGRLRGVTVRQLLQTDTLWPLVIIFPALGFGKVLGLLSVNLIAYCTPPRRVFEQECGKTGRRRFASATLALTRVAVGLLLLTVLGAVVFLSVSS